jgi:hypothetical protein
MRHPTAIITAVIFGVIVGTVARAATNDFPSVVLSPPKSDGLGKLDSSLHSDTAGTNAPVIAGRRDGTVLTYPMEVLKPSQGTNYCMRVTKPQEGKNYVIQKFP